MAMRERDRNEASAITSALFAERCGNRMRRSDVLLAILLLTVAMESACAGSAGGSTSPGAVTVAVTPIAASVALGATQAFQAVVTGSANTNVTWEVNRIPGGNSSVGTIAGIGDNATYTAPNAMPSLPGVSVTAVSQANASASGSAAITLTDRIIVTVSPATASVPAGGEQAFMASISGADGADASVTWSVNGIAGGNATLGTVVATSATTATYTAPPMPPSPATVTVSATSGAGDPESGSASVKITCAATNSISPSTASVGLGQNQSFSASFCIAVGTSVVWDVNGVVGGNSSLGTIASTGQASAQYTAPGAVPGTNPLTIHATVPSTGASASASVTVTSTVSVSVSPASATLLLGQRMSFAAAVTNATDTAVTWTVNGAPDGNATVGQVCISGSNPCQPPAGVVSGRIDFLAPASVPATNPVTLMATSQADPSRTGSALIAITNTAPAISVTISPLYAFVVPTSGAASTQQFFATVSGASNTAVSWSVQTAVAGQGCVEAACGSIDQNGIYTAPSAAPSPNAIAVTATSAADPTKSASATIAVTIGPTIEVILPSGVMAGAVESFPLEVEGVNFVSGSGSAGSVILIDGTPRSTTCTSTTSCTTPLNPSDLQTNGTLTIQVQNPGTPASLSNPVSFVIEPFDVTAGAISLSAAQPAATNQNIVVVEPTTAAESEPINVNFIGLLTGGNTCGIQGSPLTVAHPASGSTTVSLCVNGDGLDPTFTYAFTGPGGTPDGADIGVTASAIDGLLPGTIELDLQLTNATLPGLRTLIITTPNSDRAVATGMLEVQ